MPTTFILPKAADVSKTLVMLFGGNVPATPGKPVDMKPNSGSLITNYVDDNGKVVAAFVCDIPMAANAGCALSMMPASAAKDAIKTKKLESAMLDNLYEVANILSVLLMNDKTPHLRVGTLYPEMGPRVTSISLSIFPAMAMGACPCWSSKSASQRYDADCADRLQLPFTGCPFASPVFGV